MPRTAGAAAKVARVGAKYAVKYGPQAALAWKLGGTQAVEATKAQLERRRQHHNAVDKARTVVDGSVLRVRQGDDIVWVVFSGDDAVAVYPSVAGSTDEVIAHADLSKRKTPEEIDAARLTRRSRRLAPSLSRGRSG